MKQLLLVILLLVFMNFTACTKESEETAAEPTTVSVSSGSEKPYFYASGQLTIALTHDGGCGTIDLQNYVTKESYGKLSAGTHVTDALPEEWYYITTRYSCTWSAEITGFVTLPVSGADPVTGDCECQGCCTDHDGVICFEERTMCGDGTPLSDTCREKGCTANGCPGCGG